MTDNKLTLYFISVDLMLLSIPRSISANNKMKNYGCRRWVGSSPGSHAESPTVGKYLALPPAIIRHIRHCCTLPSPSQFDILNNYWICHQTKLSDTKSCVNLWLLPLNYVWLNELFIKRKWKRKKTTANKEEKEKRRGSKIKQWTVNGIME